MQLLGRAQHWLNYIPMWGYIIIYFLKVNNKLQNVSPSECINVIKKIIKNKIFYAPEYMYKHLLFTVWLCRGWTLWHNHSYTIRFIRTCTFGPTYLFIHYSKGCMLSLDIWTSCYWSRHHSTISVKVTCNTVDNSPRKYLMQLVANQYACI